MDLVITTSRFLATFLAIQLLVSCSVYSPQYSDAQLSTLAKSIDERTIVDCLFPGEVRQLGALVFVTPRIAERATVRKCRAQGGEFALRSAGALLSRPQKHELREKALQIYRTDANDGNPQAQTYLAEIFESGFGLPPDYDQAAFWYQKAAHQKFSRAQNNLAFLYEKGLGVPKNIDKAIELYAQAAGLKFERARVDSRVRELKAEIRREKRASDEIRRQLESALQQSYDAEVRVRQLSTEREKSQVDIAMFEILQTKINRQKETQKTLLEKIAKLDEYVLSLKSDVTSRQLAVDEGDIEIDFGTYHALIIGNTAYQVLDRLKTASNDAVAVAAILERKYGFKVTLLLDGTREQILDTLSQYEESLTEKDNLLIYYAGHGVLETSGYWQPIGAKKNSRANWIRTTDITDSLDLMKALHVLVVADSCYSGAMFRGNIDEKVAAGKEAEWRRSRARTKSRSAITSGGLEPVIDSTGKSKHSVFASVFLRRLEKNDGIIDARSIYEAIAPEVTARARSLVRGAGQTPEYGRLIVAGDENGAFFFVPKTMQTWLNRNFFAAMFKTKDFIVNE